MQYSYTALLVFGPTPSLENINEEFVRPHSATTKFTEMAIGNRAVDLAVFVPHEIGVDELKGVLDELCVPKWSGVRAIVDWTFVLSDDAAIAARLAQIKMAIPLVVCGNRPNATLTLARFPSISGYLPAISDLDGHAPEIWARILLG